jgi:hypothetical protein
MSIIFLFSGQSRTSPFAHNYNPNNILESYNKFIFTPEFKSQYKYKIYITTDDIHLANTFSYFNETNIGNIHLLNSDYYYKNVKTQSKNIEHYFTKYNDNIDWSHGFWKYDNSIHQHYKLMDCFNLLINDSTNNINFTNCDFIVRLRFDTEFCANILDVLENFKINPTLEIITSYDLFAIGKAKIMECYCDGLNNNYGKYRCIYTNERDWFQKFFQMLIDYCDNNHLNINDCDVLDKYKWTYAPERQLFEMLFEYCDKNNLNSKDTIKDIHCCNIIR